MKNKKLKDCFGDQGGVVLGDEPPDECLNCNIFNRCHKMTIAINLQGIAIDLSLLIQNGLQGGWLRGFNKLDEMKDHLEGFDGREN